MLPKLFLKEGVRINGAHFYREMTLICDVLRETAPPTKDGAVWITSANDSKHMDTSLHYKNRAFDIRIFNLKNGSQKELESWTARIRERLGDSYDVILEKDHLHIEYHPV